MSLLHIAGGATEDKLDASDVFSTYLYTGNGSTQTINNGIDLAGKGGLVWIKSRNNATSHNLWDTNTGVGKYLVTNGTNAVATSTEGVTSFLSNGFDVNGGLAISGGSGGYSSWTFRKAPKFFDIVTWTGNGVAGVRTIPHSLGIPVGMGILKKISTTSDWWVYHASISGSVVYLNKTDAKQGINQTGLYASDSNNIYVNATNGTPAFGANELGVQYVAYLFAHDPSVDGIIQCGSFTDSGSGATVALGWEPQYILYKRTNTTGDWVVHDSMRGFPVGSTAQAQLYPNLAIVETAGGAIPSTSATGVTIAPGSGTYIYLAIRRPNKVPTSGTQVYNAIARTGTGGAAAIGAGIVPDLLFSTERAKTFGIYHSVFDRLRGATKWLITNGAQAEAVDATSVVGFDVMDGVKVLGDTNQATINYSSNSFITHFFKRAKGFFDIVCYTGTGVAGRAIAHNLGVVPELMIVKSRSGGWSWVVGTRFGDSFYWKGYLNQTSLGDSQASYAAALGKPSLSDFTVGSVQETNNSGTTFVAYLFATLAGVSKVGSYTGNGTSQTINCGFTTGARFILVKRTDATGDWYIWDTARGIVSANDPHLSLNTTAAEVTTDDSIDPESSGFIVNQVAATNINVTSATYIFLAIA